MKCEELLAALNEYVDGDIDPGICEAFEEHLKGCNPCQIVIDNIRQTITLYREGEAVELPLRLRQKLHVALRKCWQAKYGGVDTDVELP